MCIITALWAPPLEKQGGERLICALCEGLIQRVLTRFLLVKIFDNCLPRMKIQQKRCPKCGVFKSLNNFGKNAARKNGLCSYCKQCDALRNRRYQEVNPVIAQTNKMITKARERAKNKNLPFDIDHEYVRSIVVSHCPVFGIPLEWSVQRGKGSVQLANSPSLDRIDPTKGYVKGNVWIISSKANTFKSYATHEELKILTEAVGRAIVDSLDW
ncbi:hypothetical protein EBZ39_11995 [bacterium]|nr:hypothetical protein [bacterium]